jgi:hypothetical protein
VGGDGILAASASCLVCLALWKVALFTRPGLASDSVACCSLGCSVIGVMAVITAGLDPTRRNPEEVGTTL